MLDGAVVTATSAPTKPSVVTFSNAPSVVASPATTTTITTTMTTTTALPEETILNVIKQARIDADNVAKKLKKREKDQQSKKTLPSDDTKSPAAVAGATTGSGEGNKENNEKEKKQVSLSLAAENDLLENKPLLEEGQMASPAAAVFSNRLLALLDQSLANAAAVKPMGGGVAGGGGYVAGTGGAPVGPEVEGLRSADQLIDQFRSNFTILSKKMGRAQACQLVHMLLDRHGLQMNLDMLHDNALFDEYKEMVGVSGMVAAAEKSVKPDTATATTKPATESLLVGASSQVAVLDQTTADPQPTSSSVLPTTPVDATPTSTASTVVTGTGVGGVKATAATDNNPSSTASGLDKMKRKVTFVVLGRGAIQVTPLDLA